MADRAYSVQMFVCNVPAKVKAYLDFIHGVPAKVKTYLDFIREIPAKVKTNVSKFHSYGTGIG